MTIALTTTDNGYSAHQVRTITVGELRKLLEEYDDEQKIHLHLGGRYGANWCGLAGYIEEEED